MQLETEPELEMETRRWQVLQRERMMGFRRWDCFS